MNQCVVEKAATARDYEVNLKAQLEILSLHEEMDELREMKCAELIMMPQEQIRQRADSIVDTVNERV